MEVITCADGDLHLTKGLHNVVEMGKEKKEEEEKEKKEEEAGPPVAHDCELLGITNQCLFLKLNFLVFQKTHTDDPDVHFFGADCPGPNLPELYKI